MPLTGGSSDRITRDSSGELSNQANGGAVLPNGRVYGGWSLSERRVWPATWFRLRGFLGLTQTRRLV